MAEFVAALDPNAPALQIRRAVGERERGRPAALLTQRFAVPLLETAARAFPHAYRAIEAAPGAAITFATHMADVDATALGEARGESWELRWTLRREGAEWRLWSGAPPAPSAQIVGSADAWWRLLFNALPASEVGRVFTVEGPDAFVSPLWQARSVMV